MYRFSDSHGGRGCYNEAVMGVAGLPTMLPGWLISIQACWLQRIMNNSDWQFSAVWSAGNL